MLRGKGIFIWQIPRIEGGNPQAVAQVAKSANLSHVLVKFCEGPYFYYGKAGLDHDVTPALVAALKAEGVPVWGWHYIYGDDPEGEAQAAIRRIQQLQPEGYVLDVEVEYYHKHEAAQQFMGMLRQAFPDLPLALSSFRFPSYHPAVPWRVFLSYVDYNMPQVYWITRHNPGAQLRRSVREFQAMEPYRPIIPTGSAYKYGSWVPSPAEIVEFMDTAKALGLSGANFWEWYHIRHILAPSIWETIRDYSWPWDHDQPPADITEQLVAAWNTHDPARVAALYTPTAVHVSAQRTVAGTTAIAQWYQSLFQQLLPNATFVLTGHSGTGNSRHFTWTATSSRGVVHNGNDTLGLVNGKIAYHFTFFTVTQR